MAQILANPPTLIDYKDLRFLISDAPTDGNLPLYMKEFEKYNVTDVVRLSQPTYSTEPLLDKKIAVHELPFGDGDPPPKDVVDRFLRLCRDRFYGKARTDNATIAVHCVAGLGRAPILVAIALIEYGMSSLDSVEYIRRRRKGAINSKQLKYIEKYKPRNGQKCIIQ